jgi:branched-chain amino acid transport system permease protein
MSRLSRRAFLLPAFLLLTGCGPDPAGVATCRKAIGAFEPAPERIEILGAEADPVYPDGVVIDYRTPDGTEHWIACGFAARRIENAPIALTRVSTDREGTLGELPLFFLKRWMAMDSPERLRTAPAMAEASPREVLHPLHLGALYSLQQIVNGAVLGCIYALLAVGYSLVYGILGRINFAFGELLMIGAYHSVIATVLFLTLAGAGVGVGAGTAGWVLPLVLLVASALTAAQGWTLERLVFRPLRATPTQIPLIAAIGISIALQELVRLLQGGRDRWLAPVLTDRFVLAGRGTFEVTISLGQVLVVALTLGISLGLFRLLRHSRFGRANRACSDDMRMAALLGVDTDRTVGATFALGGACAAAAGFIVALHYGGVNPYMGTLLGFKALAAAIVGGIGSVPGAFLGGVLIAALETAWAAWFPLAGKDVAVFAALIVMLVVRPTGLLGVERTRGD